MIGRPWKIRSRRHDACQESIKVIFQTFSDSTSLIAILRHTFSPLNMWCLGFMETHALPSGELCPRPFAGVTLGNWLAEGQWQTSERDNKRMHNCLHTQLVKKSIWSLQVWIRSLWKICLGVLGMFFWSWQLKVGAMLLVCHYWAMYCIYFHFFGEASFQCFSSWIFCWGFEGSLRMSHGTAQKCQLQLSHLWIKTSMSFIAQMSSLTSISISHPYTFKCKLTIGKWCRLHSFE